MTRTALQETFLHILHSQPVTSPELEHEFSSLLVMAKRRHLEMGQNISEALVRVRGREAARMTKTRAWLLTFTQTTLQRNIRCAGNGEWVDSSGNLLYVDESGSQGQVQSVLRRFYTGN